jgi:hypothetical protein
MRKPVFATLIALTAGGCSAALVHGPLQDVRIESNPPGALVTIYPQQSQRGPLFLDEEQIKVTTPGTVRLARDTSYRLEFQKAGHVIGERKIVSRYDWFVGWSPCNACELVGELPTFDMKEHMWLVRFGQAAAYEYPVGTMRSIGEALRIFSPDAVTGNAFKLKNEDDGYWTNWTGLGTPTVSADLKPLQ